jgi:hypothetical protein
VSAVERRRAIRRELERGAEPLRVVAEDVLALHSRIDLVALDARGRAVAVVIGTAGDDPGLLGRALAHRVWLQTHLPDWLKIAPDLGADPQAPAAALVIAPSFDPETVAAAASLPEGWLELARAHSAEPRAHSAEPRALGTWLLERGLHRTRPRPPRSDGRTTESASELPPFRSGLTPQEIGLTREETAAFE